MFHLDGSQTAWLIYADWLEDQDLPANFIRETAYENEIETNWWYYEYLSGGEVGGGDFRNITMYEGNSVGCGRGFTNRVGVSNFSLTETCGSETFSTIGDF